MMEQNTQPEKFARVQKRVSEIKKFYKHLGTYLLVNFFFIGRRIYIDITQGDSFLEAFTDFDNHNFFYWWGVFFIFHAAKVFVFPNLFNKDWEERKVKEYMNKKDLD